MSAWLLADTYVQGVANVVVLLVSLTLGAITGACRRQR